MNILMVCIGNICRSPMAEGIMRHKIKERGLDWTVDSAGTLSYYAGEPPHAISQELCIAHGIDISAQRARQFLKSDLNQFDLIYVMSDDVLIKVRGMLGSQSDTTKVGLFLEELYPGEHRIVPDPFGGTTADFLHAFELIEKGCEAILNKYQ